MLIRSIHDFIAPKIILTEDCDCVLGQFHFWCDKIMDRPNHHAIIVYYLRNLRNNPSSLNMQSRDQNLI